MYTSPPYGLVRILQAAKKRQFTSPVLGGNTQKLDAVVDGKLTNDLDYASIFSKFIGHKLSDSSSGGLYLRYRMNFEKYPVQTQAPHFMNMGLSSINKFNESGVLGTPATRIQRSTDRSHWGTPYHVFGEGISFGMSAAKSDHDYNYKTDFEIWRGNKEFERQTISTGQPPLDSTPIDTNITNVKT